MIATLLAIVTLFSGDPEGHVRLRPSDDRTAAMIALGLEKSVTLRGLIAEIEAGDVIIHAGREHFLPGRMTGRMKLIGRAGARRYARIAIDAELPAPHFVAALAHELQHVSELIAHRHVEDQAAMANLYRLIGREYRAHGRTAFETEAARRMGADVLAEMVAPRQLESRTTTLQFARGVRQR